MSGPLNRKIMGLITLLLINVMFFGLISPLEGSSLLLFVGFAILAVDVYLLTRLVLRLLERLSGQSWRHSKTLTVAVTLIFIIILSLQSIGQLSARDAVAILVIGVVFLLYSSYYRKKH